MFQKLGQVSSNFFSINTYAHIWEPKKQSKRHLFQYIGCVLFNYLVPCLKNSTLSRRRAICLHTMTPPFSQLYRTFFFIYLMAPFSHLPVITCIILNVTLLLGANYIPFIVMIGGDRWVLRDLDCALDSATNYLCEFTSWL